MTTNTMSIADAIYSRIDADLYKVAGPIFDIHSARLVLRLALTELATRIDEQQPQPEQPASLSIPTVTAPVSMATLSSKVAADGVSAATEQPKKRPGRPPKTQPEQPAVSPYNIATSAPAPGPSTRTSSPSPTTTPSAWTASCAAPRPASVTSTACPPRSLASTSSCARSTP